MITKADALLSLRPGAQWTLNGEDIDWLEIEQAQPTDAEIEAEIIRLTELEPVKARIANLKSMLRDTDYVSLPDYDKDKPDVLAQRAEWRAEIRQLEEEYGVES